MSTIYVDSSALVKLLTVEPQSQRLTKRLAGHDLVSSEVGWVECIRAAVRKGGDADEAEQTLHRVFKLSIDALISRVASRLEPPHLRSLDAFHLATALRMRDDIEAFVCYDQRLAEAAALHGLNVEAPEFDT